MFKTSYIIENTLKMLLYWFPNLSSHPLKGQKGFRRNYLIFFFYILFHLISSKKKFIRFIFLIFTKLTDS